MAQRINPDWTKAEQARLAAETDYTNLREKQAEEVKAANAAIEAANQAVRAVPQYITE